MIEYLLTIFVISLYILFCYLVAYLERKRWITMRKRRERLYAEKFTNIRHLDNFNKRRKK